MLLAKERNSLFSASESCSNRRPLFSCASMTLSFSLMPVRWYMDTFFLMLLASGFIDAVLIPLRSRSSAALSLALHSSTSAIFSGSGPCSRHFTEHSLYQRTHWSWIASLSMASRSCTVTSFLGTSDDTPTMISASCAWIDSITSLQFAAFGSMGSTRGSDLSGDVWYLPYRSFKTVVVGKLAPTATVSKVQVSRSLGSVLRICTAPSELSSPSETKTTTTCSALCLKLSTIALKPIAMLVPRGFSLARMLLRLSPLATSVEKTWNVVVTPFAFRSAASESMHSGSDGMIGSIKGPWPWYIDPELS